MSNFSISNTLITQTLTNIYDLRS